ncbi:homeobox domain-containing protein, partial [Circinella umbellata]
MTTEEFKPAFYNPFEVKHRRRTSRAQFKVLEKTFHENPKPNAHKRRSLAQKLGMTPRGVQVWFQNRRAKAK